MIMQVYNDESKKNENRYIFFCIFNLKKLN